MDPIDKFWDALRALTYVEMSQVAGTIRDAWQSSEYDMDDYASLMALLNSAREIHDASEDEDDEVSLAA